MKPKAYSRVDVICIIIKRVYLLKTLTQQGVDVVVVDSVRKSAEHWKVLQLHSSDCHGDWTAFLSLERTHMWHRRAQLNITACLCNSVFVLSVLLQMSPFVAGQNSHLHHKGEHRHTPYTFSLFTIEHWLTLKWSLIIFIWFFCLDTLLQCCWIQMKAWHRHTH